MGWKFSTEIAFMSRAEVEELIAGSLADGWSVAEILNRYMVQSREGE